MTEYSFGLLTGAAIGGLAAFLLLLAGDLWAHGVLPMLRRCVYRGPRLAGQWKGLGTGPMAAAGEWTEADLSLQQVSGEVRGTMAIRHRSSTHTFDLQLQAQGRVAGGYLTLALGAAGKGVRAPGTALLKVEDGRALNGQLLYCDPATGVVDVIDLSVHRTASSPAPRRQAPARPPAVIRPLPAGAPLGAVPGQ